MKITKSQIKQIIEEEIKQASLSEMFGFGKSETADEEEPHAQTPEELFKLLKRIQYLLDVAKESVDPTLEGSIDNDEVFNELSGLTLKTQKAIARIVF